MCCIPFLAEVSPPLILWDMITPCRPLARKVSGLRRGGVNARWQFSPIWGRITLNGMIWDPWCAMVVLPVMADINFNQNTFKRKTGKKRRKKYQSCSKISEEKSKHLPLPNKTSPALIPIQKTKSWQPAIQITDKIKIVKKLFNEKKVQFKLMEHKALLQQI